MPRNVLRPRTVPILLYALASVSCATVVSNKTFPLLEIAEKPNQFNGRVVETYGVVCEGKETFSYSLQPGSSCKDLAGIGLEIDSNELRPKIGSTVVLVGKFVDNSQHSKELLNYRDNGYLGNFTIFVHRFKSQNP
jgi:hypothetical protein